MDGLRRFVDVCWNSGDKIAGLGLSVAAAVCLAASISFAIFGSLSNASILATIFVVCVLMVVLPRLVSLEVFGVKARLSREIKRAEVTIEHLRGLTRISAKMGFLQIQTQGISGFKQREMVEALNEAIKAAGLSSGEAASLRRPLMEAIARDLLYIAQFAAVHLKVRALRDLDGQLRKLGHEPIGIEDPHKAEREELTREIERLKDLEIPSLRVAAVPENLQGLLDSCNADFPRSNVEDTKLTNILAHARRIMTECLTQKNIAPDFDSFVAAKPNYTGNFWASDNSSKRAATLFNSHFATSEVTRL